MSGAIPLLPQYAFMAWCSVKKTLGQLYQLREIGCASVNLMHLAQDKVQWRAVLNIVMNLLLP
jgi:hypothetical protein